MVLRDPSTAPPALGNSQKKKKAAVKQHLDGKSIYQHWCFCQTGRELLEPSPRSKALFEFPQDLPPACTHSTSSHTTNTAFSTVLPRDSPQPTPTQAPASPPTQPQDSGPGTAPSPLTLSSQPAKASRHKQPTQGMLPHKTTPPKLGETAVSPNSLRNQNQKSNKIRRQRNTFQKPSETEISNLHGKEFKKAVIRMFTKLNSGRTQVSWHQKDMLKS